MNEYRKQADPTVRSVHFVASNPEVVTFSGKCAVRASLRRVSALAVCINAQVVSPAIVVMSNPETQAVRATPR